MKKILFTFIAVLILSSCTKDVHPIKKIAGNYYGYQMIKLQTNESGNYRVTTQIGSNVFKVHISIDPAKTVIRQTTGVAYFYQKQINGEYVDNYMMDLPDDFPVSKFIN